MNDLVNRQDVLLGIDNALYGEDRDWVRKKLNTFRIYVECLPSAQPERKNGRWLPDNNCYYETRYMCSECKLPFHVETIMMKPSWRFCPNCGARMDGEANE